MSQDVVQADQIVTTTEVYVFPITTRLSSSTSDLTTDYVTELTIIRTYVTEVTVEETVEPSTFSVMPPSPITLGFTAGGSAYFEQNLGVIDNAD